jgi:hypothetical protein
MKVIFYKTRTNLFIYKYLEDGDNFEKENFEEPKVSQE